LCTELLYAIIPTLFLGFCWSAIPTFLMFFILVLNVVITCAAQICIYHRNHRSIIMKTKIYWCNPYPGSHLVSLGKWRRRKKNAKLSLISSLCRFCMLSSTMRSCTSTPTWRRKIQPHSGSKHIVSFLIMCDHGGNRFHIMPCTCPSLPH